MRGYHNSCAVSAILIAMCMTSGAFAQTSTGRDSDKDKASSGEVETVTVTATKMGTQDIQKVPMAIQVFGGEQLKDENIQNLHDLASSIPGLVEGQRQSAASSSYNIRGAGGSNANGDSPIGYYLDDVPFIVTNFGIAPPVRFFDINRIEILRGPQGTLYGQGSSGGVMVFHTRDPDLADLQYVAEAEASQTAGSGNFNYGVSGALSVPVLKDTLGIRVSGGMSYNPGWADVYNGAYDGTPDRKNVNSMRDDDIRVVGLYKPLENLSIRAQYWRFSPRQQFTGFVGSVDPAFFENTDGQPSYADGTFELWSATAILEMQDFVVTSATSHTDGHFGIFIPIQPAGPSFFSSEFYPKMLAEEIRVNSNGDGPLHWLIGGQYQDGAGPQSNLLQILPYGVHIDADNNTLTQNYAVFGEVSYDLLGGKLVPLVGLREYFDSRSFQDASTTIPTWKTAFSWRANLSYLPTDNLTIFASAATGFRPGIVQSQVQVTSLAMNGIPAGVTLNPENSLDYELGMRWRTDDGSLAVNINLYLSKFTDMQTSVTGGISGVNGFANFGDATSKGIDYEIHWQTPLHGLMLGLVGNINKIFPSLQSQLASLLLVKGGRLVNSVLYNYRLDASYNTSITDEVDGFANVSYSKSGNRFQGSGGVGPATYADPYFGINATLGVRYDRYELALTATNLTDERGPTIAFGTSTLGTPGGAIITPRTIGVRLRVNSE